MTKRWIVTGLFLLAALAAGQSSDDRLERQREAFRSIYPEVERGNWSATEPHRALLEDYVLWPDLEGAWLRNRVELAPHDRIEAYLDRYGTLKPARELRYQYALHLAESGRLDEFRRIYDAFYANLGIARLDCLALQAEIRAGREAEIGAAGLELWRTGRSQVDDCDPVFASLSRQGVLTREAYAERFELAIGERQFSLARYLGRQLDPQHVETANRWMAARDNPTAFIRSAGTRPDDSEHRRQLGYALELLGYREPLDAAAHWQRIRDTFRFDAAQAADIDRHIALWAARLRLPEAGRLLADLSPEATTVETGRWLVRVNLLARDWTEVVRSIDALPASEGGRNEWQYWRAIGLSDSGNQDEAKATFARLAEDRDYYGFLAADELGLAYRISDARLPDDGTIAERLRREPELVRARELFFVGLEARGRSEWDAFVATLTAKEQVQAARLAHEWGWHSRAISTVASAGEFDDLELRYPLPWQETFVENSGSAGIAPTLSYGVARSESLFMRDIRSGAGAVGIMQLMPSTGRQTARELNMPWGGLATLVDSGANIRLGTWYLGEMMTRFDRHTALAAAAYNAGPERVANWLPVDADLDARIWIENIPFNETRSYVRRVLADNVIFDWRLNGKAGRLSDLLVPVSPPGKVAAAATD